MTRDTTAIKPKSLEGLKRLATQIKKTEQIPHHLALDKAARQAGCQNYTHALRTLPERLQSGFAIPSLLWGIAGTVLIVLTLGVLGPALDAEPDRRSEWKASEHQLQVEGTAQLLEAEARATCARIGSENSGYVLIAGGQIQCTDKRGRKLAHKGQP